MRRIRAGNIVVVTTLIAAAAVSVMGFGVLQRMRAWALGVVTREQQQRVEARARLLGAELHRLENELVRLASLEELSRPGDRERALRVFRRDFAVFSAQIALLGEDGSVRWSEAGGAAKPARPEEVVSRARQEGRPAFRFLGGQVSSAAALGRGALWASLDLRDPNLFGDSLRAAMGEEGSVVLLAGEGGKREVLALAGRNPPPALGEAASGQAWRIEDDGRRWLLTEVPVPGWPLSLRLAQPSSQIDEVLAGPFGAVALAVVSALLLVVAGAAVVAIVLGGFAETERRLERAEDLAAMGKAAAAISHEVKNALNGLSVALDLLASGKAGAGAARKVRDHAHDEICRLRDVANDLTLFSSAPRLEAGPVDLVETCRAAAAALSAMAADHGIRVEVPGPAEDPILILADGPKLRGAIQNLLRNALEATALAAPPGARADGGLVSLRAGENGATAWVEIADSGPGLAPEVRRRMFEPFVTTKRAGTGLGLTIAQRVVQAHGGRIDHGPGEGGGAIFRVTLPRGRAGASTPAASLRRARA